MPYSQSQKALDLFLNLSVPIAFNYMTEPSEKEDVLELGHHLLSMGYQRIPLSLPGFLVLVACL